MYNQNMTKMKSASPNVFWRPSHRVFLSVLLIALLFGGAVCLLQHIFNARKAFNSAEKTRKASGSANLNDYETAIVKCHEDRRQLPEIEVLR